MARADEEIQKAKERAAARRENQGKPFRARVPVGETRQFVILDDKPDFFMYEHCLKGPDGYWNVFKGCVKETENCAVCESSGKESYYALFLSVIDLAPYTNRKGDTIEFSRKLFVVKNQQQKKFMRWYQKEGTLRGMIIECTRDGDKEPAIGNDIEIVEFMDEKELATYQRDWVDQEGKRKTEDCSVVYDYEKLFEEPDPARLRTEMGGRQVPGSRAADEEELRGRRSARAKPGDEWDDPDETGDLADEAGARDAAQPARRGARAAPASRRVPAREEAAPTRVSRTRPAAPPVEEEPLPGWTEADLQENEYLDDDGNIINEAGDILAPAEEAPPFEPDPAPAPARRAPAPAAPARRAAPAERAPARRAAPPARGRTRAAAEEPGDNPGPDPDEAAAEERAPARRVSFRGRR